MAESCFQVKLCWSTGVCPRRLQVRATLGRSLSPLSSMKTMVRPSRMAFFLALARHAVSS